MSYVATKINDQHMTQMMARYDTPSIDTWTLMQNEMASEYTTCISHVFYMANKRPTLTIERLKCLTRGII